MKGEAVEEEAVELSVDVVGLAGDFVEVEADVVVEDKVAAAAAGTSVIQRLVKTERAACAYCGPDPQ